MGLAPDAVPATLARLAHLPQFRSYTLGAGYDEMFDAQGAARAHYEALHDRLQVVDPQEMRNRQTAADLAFLHQGITFTVYGAGRRHRAHLSLRPPPAHHHRAEWAVIERGLTQRITALNLFLHDIYSDGHILSDGIVPRELVYSCKHFRREMRGVQVRHDVYVSVAGTDLVRLPDGRVRRARGQPARAERRVSYMLTNRQVIKRVFPLLFSSYDVRPIDHYAQALLATLRALAPDAARRTRPSCC